MAYPKKGAYKSVRQVDVKPKKLHKVKSKKNSSRARNPKANNLQENPKNKIQTIVNS